MKIKTIALLGLAGMLAVACGDDDKATKGSLAVSVQVAADLTDVTSVRISALKAGKDGSYAPMADTATTVAVPTEALATLDVSGTTVAGTVIKDLKAGSYRFFASAYAGDATIDGAVSSLDVSITADGVALAAFVVSGAKDLVIAGITSSNAAPKTGDVVTLTAALSGASGASLLWTDNCDGDFVTNGAVDADWSSPFVEHCTITLTAENEVTSATATLTLSVGGQKGAVERVAGNGTCHFERQGYSSSYDGNQVDYYGGERLSGEETVRSFPLNALQGLALDADDNVIFIEQLAGRVWKYNPTADTLERLAGATDPDTNDCDVHGNGGPAKGATFCMPLAVAVEPDSGNIMVGDIWEREVRRIFADDMTIDTAAGNGGCCGSPASNVSATSTIVRVASLAFDAQDNLIVGGTDYYSGFVSRVYANSQTTFTFTNVNGEDAWDIDVYGNNVYAVSRFDHYVWKLDISNKNNNLVEVAGQIGLAGNTGDGGDAEDAKFFDPRGIFIDQSNGNIFIADHGNQSIRVISQSGKISLAAKVPGAPADVVKNAAGDLYYTDRDNCSLMKVYGPY